MANLFREVKLIQRGGRYVLTGFCNLPNGSLFVVRLYDGDISRNQTVAKVMDGQVFSLQDMELERGQYTVGIQECIDLARKTLKDEERLDTKVMAGDAYRIDISCKETEMYGHRGVKVVVTSEEKALGDKDICYRVLKASDLYKQIRYWIPMGGNYAFEFFISEVGTKELLFEGNPPTVYSINVHE